MNISLRITAESAHRDCNTTLSPQSGCISLYHQLSDIYTALGAFWLCLPRSSLAVLQSCSFFFFFLAGSLSAVHFVAGKCQLSVLVLFPYLPPAIPTPSHISWCPHGDRSTRKNAARPENCQHCRCKTYSVSVQTLQCRFGLAPLFLFNSEWSLPLCAAFPLSSAERSAQWVLEKYPFLLWGGEAKWRWQRQCAIKAAQVCLCSEPRTGSCFPKH